MDNGTLVEAFKFLNYCQLAKSSRVSKRFRDLIRTNRHRLPLLYVSIRMRRVYGNDPTSIKMFDEDISPEAYSNWVIRNQYSRQISLEGQDAATESTKDDVYALDCYAYYPKRRVLYDQTSIFNARVQLNHENWPLFQHFVRLLTDPFIYIFSLELSSQNDVLNLLAGIINQDHGRLQCGEFRFNPEANSQKFWMKKQMSWIKKQVCCVNFQIYHQRLTSSNSNLDEEFTSSNSNLDEELVDFFLTGANCASKIRVDNYEPSKAIVGFAQKFMDLKECDEYQIVEFIKCNVGESVEALKLKYAEFIVKEEEYHHVVFELVNKNIGKKLKITAKYFFNDCVGFSNVLSCESISLMDMKNL